MCDSVVKSEEIIDTITKNYIYEAELSILNLINIEFIKLKYYNLMKIKKYDKKSLDKEMKEEKIKYFTEPEVDKFSIYSSRLLQLQLISKKYFEMQIIDNTGFYGINLYEKNDLFTINKKEVASLDSQKNIVKTNQLRNILSSIISISNKIDTYDFNNNKKDLSIVMQDLNSLQIQIIYTCGRTDLPQFDSFVQTTRLLEKLKFVIQENNVDYFNLFAKYFEALVSYHKYYGGSSVGN